MDNNGYLNKIFYKDSRNMPDIPDSIVDLIVTSPPYFNIKDYSKDGYQSSAKTEKVIGQIGDITSYDEYIRSMLLIWRECYRVLKPNGKLVINTPLMPMLKKDMNTHHNRHIFDINSDIEHSILSNIDKMYLLDMYIWKRKNPTKKLMFGSYPYPRNFYAQNKVEFITVYVKDGKPDNNAPYPLKQASKLTEEEWVKYTDQIWEIPIPNKKDIAFGKHAAIMPEEIVKRCIKLYTFVGDIVLDPFTGSGTTLKVAKQLGRKFIGYEISRQYEPIIEQKIGILC